MLDQTDSAPLRILAILQGDNHARQNAGSLAQLDLWRKLPPNPVALPSRPNSSDDWAPPYHRSG